MKQEDKELLLKDLCARLPYGVIVAYKSRGSEGCVSLGYGNIGYVAELGRGWWTDCKPYLRPMSSMTEEEKEEYSKLCFEISYNAETEKWGTILFDWLNANHFDYRHFIEKGLAIESPVGMYK